MGNILNKVVQKINSVSENRTVYEIMSKNVLEFRGQKWSNNTAHMRCMLGISKATYTYAHAHAYAPGYQRARTRTDEHTDQ